MIMSNTVCQEVVRLLLLWRTLEESRASNTAKTAHSSQHENVTGVDPHWVGWVWE